jgi:hypothetical protein
MDCRTFRAQHGLWIDGGLAPRHAERLLAHVGECEACAHFDAMVRRALLVARNAAPMRCSPDFAARLRARLDDADVREATPSDLEIVPGVADRPSFVFAAQVPPSWRLAAAAVLVIGVGALTLDARRAAERASTAVAGGDRAPAPAAPVMTWSSLGGGASGMIVPVAAPRSDVVVVRRATLAGRLVPVPAGESPRAAAAAPWSTASTATPVWRLAGSGLAATPVAAVAPH